MLQDISLPATRGRLLRELLASASIVVALGGVAHAQQGPDAAAAAAAQQDAAQAQQDAAQAQKNAAQAQQDEAAQAGDIIVTGYRESIEQSLAQKRNANAFVDVITAEDVGKFPDKNVADSLQRVPGVIIDRDGGEGSRVSIRGLSSDLTLTELNGNFIASADSDDPSRSFNYLLLPSALIGSVEVFKSPEARLDEGGVGGVIINHTRKPFDLEPWSGSVSAEGTYSDVTK
jgi:outer membrane receptor for ferrienterochelin and colicin